MSFKRSGPRRSLPSLPTNLTNRASCPAEFHIDAQEAADLKLGRISPARLVTAAADGSSGANISPVSSSPLPSPDSCMGRRSASPILLRRSNSGRGSPANFLRHQTAYGGFTGPRSPVHTRRPHSASSSCSSGLENVTQQPQVTLRRHNSSTGCCSLASSLPCPGSLNSLMSYSYSGNLRTLSSDDGARKQSLISSCPGTPPGGVSSSGKAFANLQNHLLQRVQLQHLQKRHLTSDSSASSDTDDTDTEIYVSGNSSNHSGANSVTHSANNSGRSSPRPEGSIFSKGAGLVHQGSIPCSHSPGSKCSAHRFHKSDSEGDPISAACSPTCSNASSSPALKPALGKSESVPLSYAFPMTKELSSVRSPSEGVTLPSPSLSSSSSSPVATVATTAVLTGQDMLPPITVVNPAPSSPSHRTGRLRRQLSLSHSMSGNLSPNQLSPSSSVASLLAPTAVPCTANGTLHSSGSLTTSAGQHHPPLQRNESMIYEEDVPVIVRRRGCLLRVRITSFIDSDSPNEDGTTEASAIEREDNQEKGDGDDQDPSTPSSGLVTPVPVSSRLPSLVHLSQIIILIPKFETKW